MYVNYVQIVARRSASEYDDEPVEVLAVRAYAANESVDAETITDETRKWLMDGRHSRFLFDERRRYADVGAAGSSVEFVLTLLASGAVGVGLQEVVNFIKTKIGAHDEVGDYSVRRFRETSTEDLTAEVLGEAEGALDLGRGELEATELERDQDEIRIRAQRRSADTSYRIVSNADQSLRIRKLT
jgi:hypothetical protein